MAEDLTHTAGPGRTAVAAPSTPPTSPPGYELRDEIGRGGMGMVYRARRTHHEFQTTLLRQLLGGPTWFRSPRWPSSQERFPEQQNQRPTGGIERQHHMHYALAGFIGKAGAVAPATLDVPLIVPVRVSQEQYRGFSSAGGAWL
jgi:hypothetical protein